MIFPALESSIFTGVFDKIFQIVDRGAGKSLDTAWEGFAIRSKATARRLNILKFHRIHDDYDLPAEATEASM